MSKYTKTTWVAPTYPNPNRYTKQNDTGTTVDLLPTFGTPSVEGTSFSASRMNNMETGIEKHDQTLGFNIGAVSLNALGQTSRFWCGICTTASGNVYAVDQEQLYKQTGGTGDFVSMGLTTRIYMDVEAVGNDLYLAVYNAGVYKVTGETGDAMFYGAPANTKCSAVACDGIDLYVSSIDGSSYYTYKQTGMTGNFVEVNNTLRCDSTLIIFEGSVYLGTSDAVGIYKQTNKTGAFTLLSGAPTTAYLGAAAYDGSLYFGVYNGYVLRYKVSTNEFYYLRVETTAGRGLIFLNGLMYRSVQNGDIYKSTSLYQDASIYATKNVALLHDDAPVGARKRIFNTGSASLLASAWNATIDGASTVTIPVGGFIEIEKTGAGTFKTAMLSNAQIMLLGTIPYMVKCKILSGTTSTAQGAYVSIPHGVSSGKILGYKAVIYYNAENSIPEAYNVPGFEALLSQSAGNIIIENKSNNSANILNKPAIILVWYYD